MALPITTSKLPDDTTNLTTEIQTALTDFVLNVFRHVEGKQIAVGRFLRVNDAQAHVIAHLEQISLLRKALDAG